MPGDKTKKLLPAIWKPETPEIHWKYDYRQIYGLDSGYHDYPWWETPHRQPELAGGEKFIPVKYGKYRRIFRRMGIYLNHRVNISCCSASASLNIFRISVTCYCRSLFGWFVCNNGALGDEATWANMKPLADILCSQS